MSLENLGTIANSDKKPKQVYVVAPKHARMKQQKMHYADPNMYQTSYTNHYAANKSNFKNQMIKTIHAQLQTADHSTGSFQKGSY